MSCGCEPYASIVEVFPFILLIVFASDSLVVPAASARTTVDGSEPGQSGRVVLRWLERLPSDKSVFEKGPGSLV